VATLSRTFFGISRKTQHFDFSTTPTLELYLQDPVPLPRELRSSTHGFMPHDGEVRSRAEVLRDRNRCVQVQDDVPPAAGHEYCFTRPLEDLDLSKKVSFSSILEITGSNIGTTDFFLEA